MRMESRDDGPCFNIGQLFRAPEQRPSKAGKSFVTATIRVKQGEGGAFWNIVAFSDVALTELSRLHEGEKLSAQGRLQIGEYEKDGKTRVSLSCIADHGLALRQPPRIHGVVERA
jgi:single-stranded DNA-binding protein